MTRYRAVSMDQPRRFLNDQGRPVRYPELASVMDSATSVVLWLQWLQEQGLILATDWTWEPTEQHEETPASV